MNEEIYLWVFENVFGGSPPPDNQLIFQYGYVQATFSYDKILYCIQLYDDLNLYERRLETFNRAEVAKTANILLTPYNLSVGYIFFSNVLEYISSDEFAIDLFFNRPELTAFEREQVFIKRQLFEYLANINLLQEQNILLQHALPVRQIFYQAANQPAGIASVAVCLDSAILLPQLNPVELNEHLRWNTEHAGLVTASVLGNSAELLNSFLFFPATEEENVQFINQNQNSLGSLYGKNDELRPNIAYLRAFIAELQRTKFITPEASNFALRINPEELNIALRVGAVLEDPWLQ